MIAPMSTSRRLNVLLVAEESAGIQTLRMLANSEHRLVGVLASPQPNSRGATVHKTAQQMGVPAYPAARVKSPEFPDWVREQSVDLLLNVHSLYVIPGRVLQACRMGAFNLHPGPLPHYAGLNAPSWAIYFGEREHAVTLHRMVPEIDAGTIAYSARFPIEEADTGLSLMSKCVRAGLPLLGRLLEAAAEGPEHIPAHCQSRGLGRYFGREVPDDGWLHWNRPARKVVDHIRAADYSPFVSPWGHPLTSLDGQDVGVVKAAPTGIPCRAEPGLIDFVAGETRVATADEWVTVRKLEVAGSYVAPRDVLSPGHFLTSHRQCAEAATSAEVVR